MAKKYHSLLEKVDGRWTIQFGDYDKATVIEERDGYDPSVKKKDLKIITTGPKQAEIEDAVAKLNA